MASTHISISHHSNDSFPKGHLVRDPLRQWHGILENLVEILGEENGSDVGGNGMLTDEGLVSVIYADIGNGVLHCVGHVCSLVFVVVCGREYPVVELRLATRIGRRL